VQVVNSTGSTIRNVTTNANGVATVSLDAATFTAKPYKPGYNFSNVVFTVSATASETLTGSAVSVSDAQLTPQDALDIVRNQVYEQSAKFWNDQEVYDYMWLAEQEIAQLAECTEYEDDSITTVSGTQDYEKPLDCLYLKEVKFDNVPLKEVDRREKNAMQSNGYGGTDASGNCYAYYEWNNTISLYPIPQRAATVSLFYIRQPAKITSSSNYFTVPKEFQHPILDFCLSRMYAKDQDETRTNFHWQLWMKGIQDAKTKWQKRKKSNRLYVQKNTDNFGQTEFGTI
jgi:hypothetical protein